MTTHSAPCNRRILLIDDNESIHQDFRKILKPTSQGKAALASAAAALFGETATHGATRDFDIDSAFQGREGLAKVREACAEGRPYAMAFVDVRMPPGWDGIETIGRIWQEYADLQVVVCTAYSDYSLEQIVGKLGRTDRMVILKKPFDAIEVVQLAEALTEKWRLLQEARAKLDELEERVGERTRELRQRQEQLFAARKMELVGQLAGGIAHDFNTILTAIMGHAELIQQAVPAGAQPFRSAAQISKSAARAATLTQQLLAFSRKQMLQPELLDVNAVVAEMEVMLRRLLGDSIEVRTALNARHPWTKADGGQVQQVLVNLALNARYAMPRGGRLTLETADVTLDEAYAASRSEVSAGEYVMIAVTDTGEGIPEEAKPHLFEPFFTTKPQGEGTGLGLAMSYGILKQSRGHIGVYSELGHGTTFKVYLPRAAEARAEQAPASHAADAASSNARGNETILLVEDDAALRDLATVVLEKLGYNVHHAANGREAIDIAAGLSRLDLLLTDVVMPRMSGKELASELCSSRPKLKVLFTSAYTKDAIVHNGILDPGIDFLHKPYTPALLSRKTREALDRA